jgi:hypothetical protein
MIVIAASTILELLLNTPARAPGHRTRIDLVP